MSIDPTGMVVFETGKAVMRSGPLWHQTLERLVFPVLGKTPLGDIKRKHITALLDNVQHKNGPSMATNVLAILRAITNWAATRDEDYVSPIVRGMARVKTKDRARSRVLADDEIRDLWAALDTANVPECYPAYMRFLMHTATRRVEAASMRAVEVRTESGRGDVWIIPAARYKSKHDHVVPLTPQAKALISDRTEPYIFSTTGGVKAFCGFSAAKKALDAEIARIRKRDGRPPMERWTTHDVRRSGATIMNSIGVPSDHVEQVLGHAIGGVKGTYNHYQYFNEKRDALTKLAAKVEMILNPPPTGKVLAFQQAIGGKDARPE
jgi:integrase